jgi:hypothetical protein
MVVPPKSRTKESNTASSADDAAVPSSSATTTKEDSAAMSEQSWFAQHANAGFLGGGGGEGDGVGDSGTFAMKPSTASNTFNFTNSSDDNSGGNKMRQNSRANVSEQSNLEAAAAALALGEDDDYDDNEGGGFGAGGAYLHSLPPHMMPPISETPALRKIEEDYPMYAEEVRMPRPLFFGPVLPPRVLNEARSIVQEALKEGGYDGVELEAGEFKLQEGDPTDKEKKAPPRLNSLPPEV